MREREGGDDNVLLATVNSVQWAPHEWGLMLACASSDDSFSILYYSESVSPLPR